MFYLQVQAYIWLFQHYKVKVGDAKHTYFPVKDWSVSGEVRLNTNI